MPFGNITILVVEDEVLIRLDMVYMLEERGFSVVQAVSADEAIAVLSAHSEIHALVSDIDLGGSMSGLDLVRLVSERWPPCRLILVSGMKTPSAREMPERTHFLPKPVSVAALDRTLTALELTA